MADQVEALRLADRKHPRTLPVRSRRMDAPSEPGEVPPTILARFLHALSDPTRLRILDLLIRERELHVSALVERLAQPQGRVSAHLTCLRTCGLVRVRREGKFRFYAITDQRIPALLALARELARPREAAIANCAYAEHHDLMGG
ncbi:metalloregulator ArsR/SmtB family transcription factor [Thermomicrobium sp. CFH 73360]|uniref:ArsR/SmtB family transcription factor n=1 Tax=Thermomicrobium sp. CFH 73360 TaxID=2951987 RepID=UPI0020775B76|nr:metalloregulator ArsR/SmtB family transcription factor [Thermomicrobium sp. CFH 73360]MCM8745937.1 metalloregulator ArsR/SmtB family transcription factor [Thermomicrobium sp. CFH 73360]